VIVLIVLLPLWCAGTLYRGSWTPDEPRESNIVRQMAHQESRVLPHFAQIPFLEKPPLYYWVAAGSSALFGDSPRALRVPNIIYAAIAVIALGAIASAMAGAEVALLAALIGGSMLLMLRVSIWLAPDGCLLAGCSVALLGAYLGYTARPGAPKLLAYSLMHVAAAVAFMAKSAPGWLVPAVALATMIAWERRWSELRRPELYLGSLLQLLIIGPWVLAVASHPDGPHALRVLFVDNLVGRFASVASADGTFYSAGHKNWPGRYLVELPLSLLPWTFLVLAALRAAWIRFRNGTLNTAWRFSLCASLPFIALLSVASTARDIYAAPAVPGLALVVALWVVELRPTLDRWNAFSLRATRIVIVVINTALAATVALIAAANNGGLTELLVVPALIAFLSAFCLRRSQQLSATGEYGRALLSSTTAFVAAVLLASLSIFPAVDRWQDLPALGNAILRANPGRPIALLQPDETTIAMVDDLLGTPPAIVGEPSIVPNWFCQNSATAHLLVALPGHAPGELSKLLGSVLHQKIPSDGIAATLEREGKARLLARYELPHGRRYALMSAGSLPCDHRASPIDRP
jgi:4-amino-4-deoxy-L-arabinose transferase-like glycosyltransferase